MENKKLYGIAVEALTEEHGAQIVEFFKNEGYKTNGFLGNITKEKNQSFRFYGVASKKELLLNVGEFTNGRKENFDRIVTLEEAKLITKSNSVSLTRSQLIDLHGKDSCSEWKQEIESILKENILLDEIVIPESSLDKLKQRGSSYQNQLVSECGIVLKNPFKVGQYVVLMRDKLSTSFYCNAEYFSNYLPETPLLITELRNNGKRYNDFLLFKEEEFVHPYDCFRLATEEEIASTKFIPEGTPCLVRDISSVLWKLAYADGKGNFLFDEFKFLKYPHVKILDINNLPLK